MDESQPTNPQPEQPVSSVAPPMPLRQAVPRILRSLLLLLVGLGILGFGLSLSLNDYMASTGWEEIRGEVTYSQLDNHTSHSTHSTTRMFQPKINYQYSYGGKPYTGHCCSQSSSDYGAQKAFVDSNPAGETIDVLVNPSDPAQSQMKEKTNPFNLLFIAFAAGGAILVIFGAKSFFG